MPTDTTTQDITEEIRRLFDTQVGHFADKSARWLFRQKENVQGLIRILAEDLEEHLDFQRLKVLNRSFVDDTLQDLQSDMVFSVPFRDATQGEDVTVYILIEHQSTVDRMMGFRLLFYMCQIWNEQRGVRKVSSSEEPMAFASYYPYRLLHRFSTLGDTVVFVSSDGCSGCVISFCPPI